MYYAIFGTRHAKNNMRIKVIYDKTTFKSFTFTNV